MAARQGLRLVKSRRRDPLALDYGTYRLVDKRTNERMIYGQPRSQLRARLESGYGMTADEVEAALLGGRP
jgi:hypothetical protein